MDDGREMFHLPCPDLVMAHASFPPAAFREPSRKGRAQDATATRQIHLSSDSPRVPHMDVGHGTSLKLKGKETLNYANENQSKNSTIK